MDFSLANVYSLQTSHAKEELQKCNVLSEKYGLSLSEEQMELVIKNRFETLKQTGRIEFGAGVVEKLVYEFCDSPYIEQEEYVDVLMELQEMFYLFKKETMEQLTDDELIGAMGLVFAFSCGSLELLGGIDKDTLYKIARTGTLEGTYLEQEKMWEDDYE